MGQQDEPSAEIKTFLIADVRGYTLFTQERGDEAAAKLAAKFAAIAREGVRAHGGSVLELRGDEALAVFASPRQALRAAIDLQLRFVHETVADPSMPLPVGIGLDAGEAVPVEGGYRGGALNLAARLCGQAGPGVVLATYEVVHLARKVEGLRYVDQGAMHLKGLSAPVRVTRVFAEAGEDPAKVFSALAPAKPRARAARWSRLFPHRLQSSRGLAVGVALLLVAVGIPIVLARTGRRGLAGIDPDSVGVIDLESNRILGQVHVGGRPGAIAVGEGAVWVTNEESATISKLDPATRSVVDRIDVGSDPVAVAIGEGAVWVANSGDGTVMRISPEPARVVRTIEAGNGPVGLAVAKGSVWVANTFDGTVVRIDPDTGSVKARIEAGDNPTTIAVGDVVWVTNGTRGTVTRIDPATGTLVGSTHVGNGPTGVVVAGNDVWVANELDGTVSRIDAGNGTVIATVSVGKGPSGIAAGGGYLWVTNELDGSVSQLDPASNSVVKTTDVGSAPSGVAVMGGELWVTARATGSVHRGGTLNLLADAAPIPDPAVAYEPLSWAILTLTHDGLVGFKRTGGQEGAMLVPDLATSLPEPTNDGRTYTFQLRGGIEFSNGAQVKAGDVRYSIERGFKSGSPTPYYQGIVGGKACAVRPETCDLSEGIVTEEASGTVTFHLTAPDPEFLFKLALPFAALVPARTPPHGADQKQTVPGTGPYMIEAISDERVEFVRNPRFREWSRAAQPDGYADRIIIGIASDQSEMVSQVVKGKADSILRWAAREQTENLMARYTNQVHLNPRTADQYLFVNTRLPPFRDVRVRQAVNYAVDRNRMVEIFGGQLSVRPTCQVLPPNSQGYRPYCPYTVGRTSGGQWTAPDLAKARQLVEQSGTAGTSVTLQYPPFFPRAGGVYLVSVLNEMGYRARLNVIDDANRFFDYVADSTNRVQVGMIGWQPDYPAAAQFIDVLLSCASFVPNSTNNQNSGQFCDPEIDAMIKQALEVQATDQSAAGELWAKIDRALVDQAAIVPLLNPVAVDFLSKRVGNYQYNPQWGMLIAQLWVQ